tara:strand:- start:324 stop:824 length:501 start_codon:yes stop_codon:yes gene_type:complete
MYHLKPEMAEELKQTESEIYRKSPKFLNETTFIATVGDICTIKIVEDIRIPNLMIIDLKTKRNIKLDKKQLETIRNVKCKEVKVSNKPGTISKELYREIQKAINSDEKTKIIVDGEEDLATLPVIKLCKNGAKVIYGMPDKGMVVVDVNRHAKERANKILERMLVK